MTDIEQPCDLCGKPHPDTTRLCHTCIKHLKADLSITEELLLDVAINGITYDHQEHASSGYVTYTPADVNQISLLDPRSGITRTLTEWAIIIRAHLNLAPMRRTPISDLIAQHLGWLTWSAKQHWAAEYAHAIRHDVRQLRNATQGKPRRIPLGPCPVTNDDNTTCSAVLKADPGSDLIRCNKCKTTWHMDTWQILGKAIS